MGSDASYTAHHPKWYRRRVSVWWWLEKWTYTKFVLRELTSLSVAYFALLSLWKVRAVAYGPDTYDRFLALMKGPIFVFVNLVALCFVLFHAVTWLNLAPKAMVVRWRGKRLPDWLIQGANYSAWVGVSAGLWWIFKRG